MEMVDKNEVVKVWQQDSGKIGF